jgi:hypothetical protein
MGRAGEQRVRNRFTWERVSAQLAAVYAEVCERPVRVGELARSWLAIGRPATRRLPVWNGSLER